MSKAILATALSVSAFALLPAALQLGSGPAFAGGGDGSAGDPFGGPGGADSDTGAGVNGTNAPGFGNGGGGGGAGENGGAGGAGGKGAAGGIGGVGPGGAGQPGAIGISSGGGGGGGGGAHGFVGVAPPTEHTTGGNGGAGGNAAEFDGGGGGAGGYGAVITGSGNLGQVDHALTGGNGGAGGKAGSFGADAYAGNGGSGGVGLRLSDPGLKTITIGATVRGGDGGNAGIANSTSITKSKGGAGGAGTSASNSTITILSGATVSGGNGGDRDPNDASGGANDGLGGAGIVGSDLTIIIDGAISGGMSGNSAVQANAITFTGGVTRLELHDGYSLIGNVDAMAASSAVLALGGTTNSTFDVSAIGAAQQFRDFTSFEKTGASTWALTGSNFDATNWKLTSGVLSVSGDSNLGDASGDLTFSGGILQVTGTSFTSTARTVNWDAGGGGFDIADPGNTFTVNQNLTGSGGLTKLGAGTLEISGINTYTGTTTVQQGTLVGASNDALSDASAFRVNSGATLAVDDGVVAAIGSLADGPSGGGTVQIGQTPVFTSLTVGLDNTSTSFSGIISGDGTLIKDGTGTLTLTGSGSALDLNLFVNDGVLHLDGGSLRLAGGVAIAGTVLVSDGGDLVSVDPIVGIGTAGTMAVDGVGSSATSAGLTSVIAGFPGTGASLTISSGAVFNSNGGALIEGSSTDSAVVNVTGAGSTWNVDNDLLIGCFCGLATVNIADGGVVSSTGATAIASGNTLNLGTGGLAGTIVTEGIENDGAIVANFTDTSTLSADISGTGTLTKAGSGELVLSGANTYTGQTVVNAGTLSVNGSIASSSLLTVNADGALGGTGILPTVQVGNGGTLAPGNSIGTITVAGNLTFAAGSTYAVEVSPAAADRTNVSGTANLTGATVAATYAPGSYVAKSYTILSAQGGLGGTTFAGLTGTVPAGVQAQLAYDAGNAYLKLDLTKGSLGGLSQNQLSVGNALDAYFDATGGIPAEFAALDADGLTLVSGEVAASTVIAGLDSADQFLSLLGDQALAGSGAAFGSPAAAPSPVAYADGSKKANSRTFAALGMEASHAADQVAIERSFESRWQGWGGAYGGSLSVDGDTDVGSHDTDADTFGLAGGISRRWEDTLVGLALGGSHSNFNLADGLGSGDTDSFNAGIFARQEFGPAYIAGAAAYGYHDVETSRTVFGDSLEGQFGAHSFAARVESGYGIATPIAIITPYAAFQAIAYRVPSYTETGTGAFALSYESDTTTVSRTELGARLDHVTALENGSWVTLSGRAALAINVGDDIDFTAGFATLPGTNFAIQGVESDQYSALVDAGAEYRTPSGFFAALTFQGEFSGNVESYAGKAKIGFNW